LENKGSKLILTFLTIMCFVLMIITYIGKGVIDPVKDYVNVLLVPVEKGVNTVGISVAKSIDEFYHLKNVARENEELKQQIEDLSEENNKLLNNKEELLRLRDLYVLDEQYAYPKVAARVIGRVSEQWFQEFRIDKGESEGIREGMNVLSGNGLCGIVTETGSHYSMVRSIIDDESAVYAMSRIGADTCLVRGNSTLFKKGLLDLTNIDKNARISGGDAIVTSNLSTKYLPGLLVGYVNEIEVNSQQLSKAGTLIPAADFENLQEVLVITAVKTETGIEYPDENQ